MEKPSLSTIEYQIDQVRQYINWGYFFHAWGLPYRRTQDVSSDVSVQADNLLADANRLMDLWQQQGRHTTFRILLSGANGLDERIVLSDGTVIPLLRQQSPPFLCLADFIRPQEMGSDTIGIFASTAFPTSGDNEYQKLLEQTVADRLAEATAECGHEYVRKSLWGYAPDESFTPEELFNEKYQGKRPAIGYPSMPDIRLNFLWSRLLDFQSMGISLSESGAMIPHASTSGLIISHPQAQHFAVGEITAEQEQSYANSLSSSHLMDFSSSSS